jgi:WhiB family redox-sensing transcriptional regulator
MAFPTKGKQADHPSSALDAVTLSSRPHNVEVPAPPTLGLSDSCYPTVRVDWQTRAACRGVGSDPFFPTDGKATAHVRRICARCPVLEECRTAALDDPSLDGIWAGTSVRERRRLRSEERLGWG